METKPAVITAEIVANTEVAPSQFHMTLSITQAAPRPEPGQFYMFRAAALHDPLLGRPFSVYNYRDAGDEKFLEILYQVAGRGTSLLSRAAAGKIEITGPLGRGFTITGENKDVVLVAGGMGAAPLSFLADRYSAMIRNKGADGIAPRRLICYLGARTAEALTGADRLASLCDGLLIATDDGSRGFHGNIVELLQRDLESYSPEEAVFYACGPAPMLKGLAGLFSGAPRSCEASLEERMACGLGACLGCAVTMKGGDDESIFKRVCKDGPVFPINDVLWP